MMAAGTACMQLRLSNVKDCFLHLASQRASQLHLEEVSADANGVFPAAAVYFFFHFTPAFITHSRLAWKSGVGSGSECGDTSEVSSVSEGLAPHTGY
ncbi:hypothetical protein chiPu_0025029, partial [Chiloscyllium punctatum]|nr:hypothetical protein [Chiloscyllium punctatum]